MNTTTAFAQRQHIKRTNNGARTPNLLEISEKYHRLLLKIGSANFVGQLRAKETPKKLVLQVWLRNGEIPNLVVNQRLKSLFNGIAKKKIPEEFETQPIIIEIPN